MDNNKENRAWTEKEHQAFYKRAIMGYVVLAIAATVGIWGVSHRNDVNLRHEINSLSEKSCIGSISTLNKYNDFVNTQIAANVKARALNVKHGRDEAARLNDINIARLKTDLLVPPTKEQCQKPILRP